MLAFAPASLPQVNAVQVDLVALGFALLLAIASSMIFGLAPALQASRVPARTGPAPGGQRLLSGRPHGARAQHLRGRRSRPGTRAGRRRRAARAEPRRTGLGGHGFRCGTPARAAHRRAGAVIQGSVTRHRLLSRSPCRRPHVAGRGSRVGRLQRPDTSALHGRLRDRPRLENRNPELRRREPIAGGAQRHHARLLPHAAHSPAPRPRLHGCGPPRRADGGDRQRNTRA